MINAVQFNKSLRAERAAPPVKRKSVCLEDEYGQYVLHVDYGFFLPHGIAYGQVKGATLNHPSDTTQRVALRRWDAAREWLAREQKLHKTSTTLPAHVRLTLNIDPRCLLPSLPMAQ